jgi:hypothetical protein
MLYILIFEFSALFLEISKSIACGWHSEKEIRLVLCAKVDANRMFKFELELHSFGF